MEKVLSTFNSVLQMCKGKGVSDIHLCVGSPWKCRVNGHIVPIAKLQPLKPTECEFLVRHIVLETKSVTEQEVDEFVRKIKDYDCSYSLPGIARFRVNICRQRGTFSVVLRIIPFNIPTVDKLNLPEVIKTISNEERGLILVTGVTGSGKSTTLASMVNQINHSKPCKIVTIEDPIEYLHNEVKASVVQREVGYDTESFSKALRAALRQDPDIILVGEMRDRDTIETALKAAETGHLVMSTLHTEDAPKTIHRIISVFDLNEQKSIRLRLAESVRAVISQRLLRRKDNEGRVVALEVMRNTLSIKDCIENPEKSGNMKDIISNGKDTYGMQTFDQHLMELYTAELISLDTAKAAATSPADFERAVTFG